MGVDQLVVELEDRGVELRDDDVLVVALVADQRALRLIRGLLVVARQVADMRRLIQLEQRPPEPELLGPSYM